MPSPNTTAPGAPDTGPSNGETLIDTFSTGMTGPAGIVYGGSYTVDALSISGIRAAPAGSTSGGAYFATPGSEQPLPGTATIDYAGYVAANGAIRSLSFYWGSVDQYNTVDVFDRQGGLLLSLVGNDIHNPANGNQIDAASNRRLFLRFADTDNFGSFRLTSTQRAFEIDDVAVSAVPEPATWSMLIAGMGLVGFAARRRRHVATVPA